MAIHLHVFKDSIHIFVKFYAWNVSGIYGEGKQLKMDDGKINVIVMESISCRKMRFRKCCGVDWQCTMRCTVFFFVYAMFQVQSLVSPQLCKLTPKR